MPLTNNKSEPIKVKSQVSEILERLADDGLTQEDEDDVGKSKASVHCVVEKGVSWLGVGIRVKITRFRERTAHVSRLGPALNRVFTPVAEKDSRSNIGSLENSLESD